MGERLPAGLVKALQHQLDSQPRTHRDPPSVLTSELNGKTVTPTAEHAPSEARPLRPRTAREHKHKARAAPFQACGAQLLCLLRGLLLAQQAQRMASFTCSSLQGLPARMLELLPLPRELPCEGVGLLWSTRPGAAFTQ